jgi:hypothetical protein
MEQDKFLIPCVRNHLLTYTKLLTLLILESLVKDIFSGVLNIGMIIETAIESES